MSLLDPMALRISQDLEPILALHDPRTKLSAYHDMPYAEIARTLKISEGAVKTRIFRAMETLKETFEGDARWNAAMS